MDFVNFIKRTNYKIFGKIFLTKEEIYNENSGETQSIQVFVNPDYYNAEFKTNGKDRN